MSDPLNLAAGAAEAISRLPRTTYKIPEGVRNATDPRTVTLRQLTYAEEKAAMEAKERGGGGFLMEGAKRSLCAVDDTPVTWTDNQAEIVFTGLSNKVRDLVVQGFGRIALPSKDESEDFLSSALTS
jgi:hypothetical protein